MDGPVVVVGQRNRRSLDRSGAARAANRGHPRRSRHRAPRSICVLVRVCHGLRRASSRCLPSQDPRHGALARVVQALRGGPRDQLGRRDPLGRNVRRARTSCAHRSRRLTAAATRCAPSQPTRSSVAFRPTAPGDILAASWVPEDGQADPVRAIDVLRGAFVELGGTVLVGRASLLLDPPRVGVRVGEDRIDASSVVVAAGAESGALLERFGWEVPMDPSPGLLVLTEPTDSLANRHRLCHALLGHPHPPSSESGRQGFDRRARHSRRGREGSHHGSRAATAGPGPRILPLARRCCHGPFHRGVAPDAPGWDAHRGTSPGLASVYVAAAHAGVTLAPALGELVAQEIIENKTAARLEPFRPARFSEHRTDAHVSIEEAFQLPSEVFLG